MSEVYQDANPSEMCGNEPIIENVDPLIDMNIEENAAVKYEIIHDHNEVDDILDDSCPNVLDGVKREKSWHEDEAIPSSSGAWSVDSEWNDSDSRFDCETSANLIKSVDRSISPNIDNYYTFEVDHQVNTASLIDENAIPTDDVDECAMHEIAVPSTSGSLANSDNHTINATDYGSESSAATANNIGEHAMNEQGISNPGDVPHLADDINHGADKGLSGAVHSIAERNVSDGADAAQTNIWKIAACNDSSDDDVWFIEPEEWPKAKTFEVIGFIKKENDRFSGDLPFSLKVYNYHVYSTLIIIPMHILDCMDYSIYSLH